MLIILYIITVIFSLTNYQPLTIPAILFGVCYLPGLALFTLIKEEALQFEDLVLAFAVSIGISSLLTLSLLYAGIHVRFIYFIIIGIIGILILAYSIKFRNLPSLNVNITGNEIRFVIVALIGTLIFSIPVVSERMAVSAHGLHHFTLVSQILNGIFPPENPGLGGTSVSYHWGYHALVATLSYPTDFHPLRIISTLNVISLFLIFCIAYGAAKLLDLPEWYSYLVPLALIGLMRSDAIIFFLNKIFSGKILGLREIPFPEVRPSEILQSWIWGGGAPWFDRRMLFLNKFYNANTMPLGIGLCLSYFFFLLIYLKKLYERRNNIIYTVTFSLLIIANCIIYPPLAIVLLLHVPIWASVALFMKRKDFKAAFRETVMTFITFTFSVIIVLPYLLSVSSDTSEPVMRLNFYGQSIINIISFWLPMPVILAGLVVSYKKLSRMVFWFLSVAASICFGLSVFTRVALDNSEKFTFILSFFYAIYFVLAISSLLHLISKQWVKRTLSTCILIFLLITPVITEAAYIVSPWFRDNTYAFSGRHVLFSRDEERNDAYTWIRNNTPAEALLMLSYMETSERDMIAQNSTYEPAALSERNLFVVKDWYTVSNPEFRKRVKIREKLFANYSDHEVRDFFRSLNSPVYLLVEDQLPPIYLTDKIFHDFPKDPEGFTLVFSNERQKVYHIRE